MSLPSSLYADIPEPLAKILRRIEENILALEHRLDTDEEHIKSNRICGKQMNERLLVVEERSIAAYNMAEAAGIREEDLEESEDERQDE